MEMFLYLYRCVIPTNAVHNDSDPSVGEAVYVGLVDQCLSSPGDALLITRDNKELLLKRDYQLLLSSALSLSTLSSCNSPIDLLEEALGPRSQVWRKGHRSDVYKSLLKSLCRPTFLSTPV